ncbi:DUF1771-domain-containing protein [Hygrophoropsis aurantiaca]|uniref:DUF1771-domain-containing protein n=1 Tax=Hygrophoropsis aurantiaca TaxID=72124 RepID=A0ACB8AU00_9AGAM|nr:DUF1771-domain-containing protein [Hygrophoropsis aurantiaca]
MAPWLLIGLCAAVALYIFSDDKKDKPPKPSGYGYCENRTETFVPPRREQWQAPLPAPISWPETRIRPQNPIPAREVREESIQWAPQPFQDSQISGDSSALLRQEAREAGLWAAQRAKESQEAYKRGDRAAAKRLSVLSKEHKARMLKLDAEASEQIFRAKNAKRKSTDVDLHGLYVNEAVEQSLKAIGKAKFNGSEKVRLIVGKGLGSDGGIPKIKPAVTKALQKLDIRTKVDPRNEGVLIAYLIDP